jgi:uncharacterized protein (DUF983 family)
MNKFDVHTATPAAQPESGWGTMLGRGILMRCPVCGKEPAFDGFLRVRTICRHCQAPLGSIRCDDAPPYITMTLALLVSVIGIVASDNNGNLNFSLALGLFLPLVVLVSVGLLRPVKGMILAVMLKNKIYNKPLAN